MWYSMENLAGDLLLGLKFVKLSILPIGQVGGIKLRIFTKILNLEAPTTCRPQFAQYGL